MNDAPSTELQRLLGSEFENRGWEYDLTVGRELVQEIERSGGVDAAALARTVSSTWLERNGANREDVAAAIERAVGGRTPRPVEPGTTVLNFDNRSYTLRVDSGGQIAGSQVNVGGTQINIHAGASRDEILAGVGALFRAGLEGDWSPEIAGEMAAAIDARDDIGFEDVEGVVKAAAAATREPPNEGRMRGMLHSITEQGIGGALGTGISAAVGWLLSNAPV